jgi:ribonuclease BN (tRNA processing enzyme)
MGPVVRLTVVGSADAFNSCGRGHSCYLLEGAASPPVMVDFGATALAALRMLGREPTELGGIAVTHLHGDHIGGLPYLLIDGMFHAIRREPLLVVGPAGSAARIELVLRAAYGSLAEAPRPFALEVTEIAPGGEAQLGRLRLAAFAAVHTDPPEQSLCLRLTAPDGTVIAFSGDTAVCPGLFEAAAGADLLVAECSGVAPPCGPHISWQAWRELLPALGAKRVLLAHLGTEVRTRAAELLAQRPGGIDLAFADDGMLLEV